MPVRVEPPELHLVAFTSEDVAAVAARAAERLGMADADITVEVDESTPLTRTRLVSTRPLVIRAESGALEDPKRPRLLSPLVAETSLAILLLRARDLLDPAFGAAPPDDELPLPLLTAWTVSAAGRLAALGLAVHEPRWRYHFRTRHGFTDVGDAAYERLWADAAPTWARIVEASEVALGAKAAV